MKDGRYTVHFASNKTVRLYHFNDDRNVMLTINPNYSISQNKIIRSASSPLQIKPETLEFQDCMLHQLQKNCSYPIDCQSEEELLEGNIQCEVLNTTTAATNKSNSFTLETVPNNSSQCELIWIAENQTFEITMNKRYRNEEIDNAFNGLLGENDLFAALTCQVALAYHSERVKFGIPFIVTNGFLPIPSKLSTLSAPYSQRNVVIATWVTATIVLLVCSALFSLTFCWYRKKTHKP